MVVPVKRVRKKALVPAASSDGVIALQKIWYGEWKSIPMPIPAMSGYTTCHGNDEVSWRRFMRPGLGRP